MEHKTVYKCTGSCGGVSPVMKNCGAPHCERHNEPLKPFEQCDGCAAASDKDDKPHVCDMCKPL